MHFVLTVAAAFAVIYLGVRFVLARIFPKDAA
jgi:hypothetical protein